jgi:hypothetical protein
MAATVIGLIPITAIGLIIPILTGHTAATTTGEPAGTGIGTAVESIGAIANGTGAGAGMGLNVGTRLDAGTAAAADGEARAAFCGGTEEGCAQDRAVRPEAAAEADADFQAGMGTSGEADEIRQVLFDKRIHPFIGK